MTNTEQYYCDFKQIVQDITQKKRYGKDDLAIWGGVCAEAELLSFLNAWSLDNMPFRVWEYVSEINFQCDTLPANVNLLERGRLFGEDGDLTLRRDSAGFRWHFVGKPEMRPPSGFDAKNFWTQHQEIAFHCCEETALLWGERQEGGLRWFDDRVGQAKLEYPVKSSYKRVQVCYRTFSRAGRVEFVWFHALEIWEEDNNDGYGQN